MRIAFQFADIRTDNVTCATWIFYQDLKERTTLQTSRNMNVTNNTAISYEWQPTPLIDFGKPL